MGIMVPETCWEIVKNKHLTVASCWFSLSLHNLLTMHGHRNLKLTFSSFNVNEMGSHWALFLLYLDIVLSWPEDGWLWPKHVAKYKLIAIIASCLDVCCILMVHNMLHKHKIVIFHHITMTLQYYHNQQLQPQLPLPPR